MLGGKTAVALGTWVLHVLAFILLHRLMGLMVVALAILPVVAIGWLFGMRAGLLASLLAFSLNMLLVTLAAGTSGVMMSSEGLMGSILLVLIGAAVGWLHDLSEQMKQEITERKQAEEELGEYRSHLEKLVDERTAELIKANEQLQREITERKQVEEALTYERDLFHALMDNIPDRIYFKGTQGRFLRVSKTLADMHGLSDPAQLVGKTDFDFFTEEHARQFYADEQEVMQSGQPSVGKEEKEMWLDGRETWSLTSITPFRDKEGNIIGIFGIARDITPRKRAEEEREQLLAELEAKNRELDSFVYTVSHDLRSPLVSLQGFSTRLLESYSDQLDGRGRLYVERIQANTEHMGELISDLLELSRIGRVVGPLEAVPLGEVVDRVVQQWELRLRERSVELEVAPDLPTVQGDRHRLEQVMANLLDNAVKFMDQQPRPRVEVGWRDEGEAYVIYVRDNGIGIAPPYHDRIFDIFQRLEEVQAEGTGVGLAIVKRIVEHHGGRVWVESERGQGATLYFSLPHIV